MTDANVELSGIYYDEYDEEYGSGILVAEVTLFAPEITITSPDASVTPTTIVGTAVVTNPPTVTATAPNADVTPITVGAVVSIPSLIPLTYITTVIYESPDVTYDDLLITYEGVGGGEGYEWSEEASAITLPAAIGEPGTPSLIVEVDYTSAPLSIPTDWVELPTFRAVSIHQGRQQLLQRTEVGQATVVLDNREREYDPTLHPEVRPGNHLRIRARPGGLTTVVDLFRGFVRSWPQEWPGGGIDATSTVQVEDAFSLMARYEMQGASIAEMQSGEHLRTVLTMFGWPEAGSIPDDTEWWLLEDAASELGTNTFLGESLSQIDDGVEEIMALDLEGNLLDHLLNVAETTEGGTFYVGPSGDLVFRQRQVGGDEPIGTWGDEEGELKYTDLVITYDDSTLYNHIWVQRRGDPTPIDATVIDDESVELYGARSLVNSDLLHSTLAAAEDRAAQALILYSIPTLYPRRITMRPGHDSPLWNVVLGIPLMTAITIRRRPPGGGEMIELSAYVIGVTYDIDPDVWNITWDLAAAPRFIAVWLLGQAGRSELGTTTALG